MSMIYLSGKYLNLDNVVSIEEPQSGDNIMYIHYVTGGRDSLIANSPEAAALRHWLNKKAVDVQAAYQAHLDEQERDYQHKEFEQFCIDNQVAVFHGFKESYREWLWENDAQPNEKNLVEFTDLFKTWQSQRDSQPF